LRPFRFSNGKSEQKVNILTLRVPVGHDPPIAGPILITPFSRHNSRQKAATEGRHELAMYLDALA
jgi:hypothetical protein